MAERHRHRSDLKHVGFGLTVGFDDPAVLYEISRAARGAVASDQRIVRLKRKVDEAFARAIDGGAFSESRQPLVGVEGDPRRRGQDQVLAACVLEHVRAQLVDHLALHLLVARAIARRQPDGELVGRVHVR